MTRDPLEVWRRSVRRCLRDFVRDQGEVPGLVCFVSKAKNPRKVQMLRLELVPDRSAVRTVIREEAERHGSGFAAYGALSEPHFLLVCMDAHRVVMDAAECSAESGMGGWFAAEFQLGDNVDFVQGVLV